MAAASLILAGCGGTLSGGSGDQGGGGGGTGPGGRGGSGGGGAIGVGGAPWQCGAKDLIPAVLPPDLLFVLDASAAMNDDISGAACSGGCGRSSKWAQAAAAIERLAAEWDAVVNMGLEIFPDPGSVCAAGGGVAVPVGPAHATAITAAISARTSANGGVVTGGNAPIRSAVEGAMSYLTRLTDPGSKNILLATAGAPNCLPGGGDTGADDSAGSVQAIRNAATEGIRTTVLGIVTPGGTADGTLDEMASAGGGIGPGWPRYTPVSNLAELMTTLDTLLGINPPCTFSLPAAPTNDGTTTRANISVILDGTEIPRDPNHLNGWDYLDASQSAIQLYGPACQALAAPPHTISIVFRCLLLQ